MLLTASILCGLIGIAHSYLGEKYILIRLFRMSKLPHLFGNDVFTKQTLRFAWHITTIAWWGFGFIIWAASTEAENFKQTVLITISVVFFISGLISLIASRGKHLSWIIFLLISLLIELVSFA